MRSILVASLLLLSVVLMGQRAHLNPDKGIELGTSSIVTGAGTITSVELDRLTGLIDIIATDPESVTSLDGDGLNIISGVLNTQSDGSNFLEILTVAPTANGGIVIDSDGDGALYDADILTYRNLTNFHLFGTQAFPTDVDNICIVYDATLDQVEWSSTSCTAGGATDWENIGDAGTNGAIAFANTNQTMDWDSPDTATALRGMDFGFIHDATSDSDTQRGVIIQRLASAGTATFETLLRLNNVDTDGLVREAIDIGASGAGGMTTGIMFRTTNVLTTAIDASDPDIVTALDIGDNTLAIATSGIPLASGDTATECVMLDAQAINCNTTAGCTTSDIEGTNFDFSVAVFSAADDEDGSWSFELPDNLAVSSTFTFAYTWTMPVADSCAATTNDTVCFEVVAASFANDENWRTGALAATPIGIDDKCTTIETGDHLYRSATSAAVTPTGWAAGERAVVRIARDTDSTPAGCVEDDDITNAVHLLGLRICYEVDNVFSGE